MKIIEPSVSFWKQFDYKRHVARCARICYHSMKDDDGEKIVDNLLKNKHNSMFRHMTIYSIIPKDKADNIYLTLSRYVKCPYIKWTTFRDELYIVTNGNFLIDIEKNEPVLFYYIVEYIESEDTVFNKCEYVWQHYARYTFKIITQISTSRELNRVSPNNTAEQSTRYVLENGVICRPWWMKDIDIMYFNNKNIDKANPLFYMYVDSCNESFISYSNLIECEMLREDARGVLPLDTATVCAYTYSIEEWRKIIDLRYYGTTGKPHPNAKIIAGMIRDCLIELGYEFK